MSRHPQNGPTFSIAPSKKQIPMTDEQRANWLARKDAQQVEIELIAAKTRQFSKFLRTDPLGAVQELGLLKGN
jgi:hypothetical protein